MNKKIGAIIVLVFAVILIPLISAEIFLIEQPKNIYSIGENLEIVLGTDGEEGWAMINLVCGNSSKMVYYDYLTKYDTSNEIIVPLRKSFLRDLIGNCYLSLIFKEQEKKSLDFEITGKMSTNILFDSNIFEPNQTMGFSGTVTKTNKQNVNGFIEISFSQYNIELISPIENNKFNGELIIPGNIPAGEYNLEIFSYEKDEFNEITNFDLSNTTITISQKPLLLVVEADKEVNPNSDLQFKAMIYDQASMTIDGSQVAFKITNPNGEEVLNILSKTGDSNTYNIRKNAFIGYWNLSAESRNILEETQFYVNENKEAEFNLVNDTLVVKNVGNVPYDKFVKIKIGENYSEIKNFNLSVGSSIEFQLTAPEGNYSISVSDDLQEIQGIAALTGNVIGIRNMQDNGLFNKSFIIWAFLIAVLGMFVFVTSRKIINKKSLYPIDKFSSRFSGNQQSPDKGGVIKVTPSKIENVPPKIEKQGSIASHSLVIDGSKQNSAILALKIKNYEEILKSKSNAIESLDNIVKDIPENNGRVYRSEDFIIGIFAPVITRTFNNSLNAIKTADLILTKLNHYNSLAKQKINFGIGVNLGDIVAKEEKNKLFFTPLKNVLSVTKKIAEIAQGTILLSPEIQKSVLSKVKTISNPEKFGVKTYSISEIVDKKQNEKFISGFLKRNQEYKRLDDFKFK